METRGRPFEPGNKFGRGRPRGSRNKSTLAAEALLAEYDVPLMRKAIVMGLNGDGPMLKTLLQPKLRACSGSSVVIGRFRIETADDLSKASIAIFDKAAKGEISLEDAQRLSSLLIDRGRIIETQDIEKRLRDLEKS